MYSIEEIKEKLSEYGCSIVDDNEYINITTPLTLEKDGYYTKMCVHNIFYNEIITKYTSILNSLNGTFQTNMPMDKITDLIKQQINSFHLL